MLFDYRKYEWAKNLHGKPLCFWVRVVFSDESRFLVFSDSGRVWVWRKTHRAYQAKRLQATVKFGGGSVMVWGAIFKGGGSKLVLCDGRMNSANYITVLEDGLLPILNSQNGNLIFMEDGAPCHTAKATQKWQSDRDVDKLPWPNQSPDMNPIEIVWGILDRELRSRQGGKPSSTATLMQSLHEAWEAIPQEQIDYLIDSMPRRIEALVGAKGRSTKYSFIGNVMM